MLTLNQLLELEKHVQIQLKKNEGNKAVCNGLRSDLDKIELSITKLEEKNRTKRIKNKS